MSTLSHLTCKTYSREITADEKEVRDLLIRTIRSDFSALTARMDEASFEICYTRWSMASYCQMCERIRAVQQVCSVSFIGFHATLNPLFTFRP